MKHLLIRTAKIEEPKNLPWFNDPDYHDFIKSELLEYMELNLMTDKEQPIELIEREGTINKDTLQFQIYLNTISDSLAKVLHQLTDEELEALVNVDPDKLKKFIQTIV